MIRVSDYLAKRVAEMGVRHVFMISGGGAMHLNDAFGKHEDLQYICNHHEQACAIAAEGYARISGNIGVAVVTSGPAPSSCTASSAACFQGSDGRTVATQYSVSAKTGFTS